MIRDEDRNDLKTYDTTLNKFGQMNHMFDFIYKTISRIDAKDSSVIENMYMLLKQQSKEKQNDTNKAVIDYKKNAMNPNRLVAKLEKNKMWKKHSDHLKNQMDITDLYCNNSQFM